MNYKKLSFGYQILNAYHVTVSGLHAGDATVNKTEKVSTPLGSRRDKCKA